MARLDAAVSTTRQPVELACLKAERAALLARMGRHGEAADALARLHAEFDPRPDPAVSAWVGLAEALNEHVRTLAPGARDRLRRAHAIAAAARLRRPQALCAAWLAYLDGQQCDGLAAARHLSEVFDVAPEDHHGARSRACLVIALALHAGGRPDDAMPWYARAREHAAAEGDDATLAALAHDMAWLRGAQARAESLFGSHDVSLAAVALTSAESAENLERLLRSEVRDASLPMLRAQLLTECGRHAEALALFDLHLDRARAQGLGVMEAAFAADMAWCAWHTGQRDAARSHAAAATFAMTHTTAAIDRACAHARLAALLALDGRDPEAAAERDRAQAEWSTHRSQRDAFLAAIEPVARRERP